MSERAYKEFDAWDLNSTVPLPVGSSTVVATKPTIFVHGFQADPANYLDRVDLRGGSDYWGKFPQQLSKHVQGALAFEFRWATNARFEMVASDLARAIDVVYLKTGKQKVTLVAHSFGGVLVRTLLQGLALRDASATLSKIDQVITLGSPHSGIGSDDNAIAAGFPKGQDSLFFLKCQQISCDQMGQRVEFGVISRAFLELTPKEGDLAIRLRDGKLQADLPIAVGIGLARNLSSNGTAVRGGDALITIGGQRFQPTLSGPVGTVTASLAKCGSIDGKRIEEVLLGDDLKKESSDDWQIGMVQPASYLRRGYVHSPGSIRGPDGLYGIYSDGNYFEAAIDDATNDACSAAGASSCVHAGFALVYEAMTEGICSLPVITALTDVTAPIGGTALFAVTPRGWHRLAVQWFRQRVGGQAELISTNAAVALSGLAAVDDGSTIRVVVTNSAGRTESSAVVHVVPDAVAPRITADPLSVAVFEGQPASFSVAATGTAPLTYRWARNGVDIPNTNAASYVIPSATLLESGSTYSVTASNSAGSAMSKAATLIVNSASVAPTITAGPTNSSVAVGSSATFSVTSTGSGLSYEWRKGTAQSSVLAPGGSNSATLTTPPTTLADNGNTYFVVVRNSAGSATSQVATLTLLATPPSGGTQVAIAGAPDAVRPGQLVQYAVTVSNRSAQTLDYTITAQVPNGTTVAYSAISQSTTFDANCGANVAVCAAGSTIRWGLSSIYPVRIAAGQSATVSFSALVDATNPPPNGTVIRSTATASASGTGASAAVDVVVAP